MAEGESAEDVLAQAAKHAKEKHGLTDEQVNNPEMLKKAKAAVKQK